MSNERVERGGADWRPRELTFVETGQRVRLPGSTPVISKPWNMDPVSGAAVSVAERHGCPLLRYTANDGTEAEILARPVPLAEYNPGDEVLVNVQRLDAAGHPVYELAVVRVD